MVCLRGIFFIYPRLAFRKNVAYYFFTSAVPGSSPPHLAGCPLPPTYASKSCQINGR